MNWSSSDYYFKVDPSLKDIFSGSSGGKTTTKRKPKPKLKRKPKPKSKRNNPEMYPPTKKKKTNKVLKGMGLKEEGHWKKMFKKNFGG